MIALIAELSRRKGLAYPARRRRLLRASTSFPRYGKLSQRRLDDMQAGARIEVDERKRHPMDFALWKASKPGEPAWDSPWGPGGRAGTSSARRWRASTSASRSTSTAAAPT